MPSLQASSGPLHAGLPFMQALGVTRESWALPTCPDLAHEEHMQMSYICIRCHECVHMGVRGPDRDRRPSPDLFLIYMVDMHMYVQLLVMGMG